MIRKIFLIFKRDLKVSVRNFITLYIIVVPIIFAVIINVFSPGINDTTVEIVLIEGENVEQGEYFEQFAKVEFLNDLDEMEERVKKRDNIINAANTIPHLQLYKWFFESFINVFFEKYRCKFIIQ